MASVTNELIYEVLKSIQDRLSRIEDRTDALKSELQAILTHMIAQQQDIGGIYSSFSRLEDRFDRIERRLELSDLPTP